MPENGIKKMETKNRQFIKISGDENVVAVKTRLLVEISPEKVGGYFSYCPSLDLCSQGETVQEAKNNIKEAVELFMESCLERGTLHKTLARRGFLSGSRRRTKTPPKNVRTTPISVNCELRAA